MSDDEAPARRAEVRRVADALRALMARFVATEAPLGVSGVFLVSRGDKTPWRLKLRTPSFNHVSALEQLLRGVQVDALEATLASVGYVVGDIDK